MDKNLWQKSLIDSRYGDGMNIYSSAERGFINWRTINRSQFKKCLSLVFSLLLCCVCMLPFLFDFSVSSKLFSMNESVCLFWGGWRSNIKRGAMVSPPPSEGNKNLTICPPRMELAVPGINCVFGWLAPFCQRAWMELYGPSKWKPAEYAGSLIEIFI